MSKKKAGKEEVIIWYKFTGMLLVIVAVTLLAGYILGSEVGARDSVCTVHETNWECQEWDVDGNFMIKENITKMTDCYPGAGCVKLNLNNTCVRWNREGETAWTVVRYDNTYFDNITWGWT